MENQPVTRIVDEVHQLCSQYLQEVPSRRRVWPKSIKDRVLQLLELELSSDAIAAQTGIPVATIYSWKSVWLKSSVFLPVKVVENKMVTARPEPPVKLKPKPRRYRMRSPTPTITVVAPNGVRFEGLDVASAFEIASRLGFRS